MTDFSRGDRIVLTGSEADYTVRSTQVDGHAGTGIFQGVDLVALIQGPRGNSFNISDGGQALFI